MVIATFSAVIVGLVVGVAGLFKERIHDWRFPIRLGIDWKNRPPFCRIIWAAGQPFSVEIFVRLTNVGESDATNLRVLVEDVSGIRPDGSLIIHERFTPFLLTWATEKNSSLPLLPRGAHDYLKLGTCFDPKGGKWVLGLNEDLLINEYDCLCLQLCVSGNGGVLLRACVKVNLPKKGMDPNEVVRSFDALVVSAI